MILAKIRRKQSKFKSSMLKIFQRYNVKTKKGSRRRSDDRIILLVNAFDPSQLDDFLKNMAASITL